MRTAWAARTCVTLFINPAQFGPDEDLDAYPRDEAADTAALAAKGADLLFAPGVEEMYPEGHVTAVSLPGIGDCLFTSFSRAGAVGAPWRSADPARERFGQLAVFSLSPSDLSLVRILSATCLATSSRSASGTSV